MALCYYGAMNTTSAAIKKTLVAEVERLATLPGNWDGNGGAAASPRATGHYKRFLELVPMMSKKYFPHLENDGSIRVAWRGELGKKEATFLVLFGSRGNLVISSSVDGKKYENTFPNFDADALQSFAYAAN